MSSRSISPVLCLVAGLLASCSALDAPANWGAPHGTIAFVAFPRNADMADLAFMAANGSDLRLLPLHAFGPSYSPDGKKIAVGTDTGATLSVINADGSNRRVIASWRLMLPPAWSPDGKQIAAACTSDPLGATDICLVDANGGPIRRIAMRADAYNVTWSPDGQSLVFSTFDHGLFVINADGSGMRQLTTGYDDNPQWSRATNQIVYTHDYRVLTIINPDGSLVRTLPTPQFSGAISPAWSPDGRTIAFVAQRDSIEGDAGVHLDYDSIYLIPAEGGPLTRLTRGMDAEGPAWAP